MMETKARDLTYDVARGIGMALVIYGHLLDAIFPARPDLGKDLIEGAFDQWQIIYSFHMMLFFLISGAVNKNLPGKKWPDVLRGSLRLLALAWIVHIAGALAFIVSGYNPDASRSVYGVLFALFDPIVEGYYWSIGVLWFLTSLCFVQLIAYGLLRNMPSIWLVAAAVAISLFTIYAPNYFLFKTWFPGLSFFLLGYFISAREIRFPVWAFVPLFAGVIVLAPLNHGCPYSFAQQCSNAGPGRFGVWMFAGIFGNMALFYITALLGSLGVMAMSRGLARFRGSSALVYMGKKSLNLFILNGFVAGFVSPLIATITFPHLNALAYAALFVALIAAHLVALPVLNPVLDLIDRAAAAIATALAWALTGGGSINGRAKAA